MANETPTFFADAVSSMWWTQEAVKVFFLRVDPDPRGIEAPTPVAALQVVMPTNGFLNMFVYFQHRVNMLVDAGTVSREAIAKMLADLEAAMKNASDN